MNRRGLYGEYSHFSRLSLVLTLAGDKISPKEKHSMIGTIIIVLLILLLVGSVPRYSYSRSWGYAPSGVLGVILLIVIILLLTGRLR